ncbi:MAG: alpha/beta hydrolase [Deinococcales bacterium]
MPLQLQNVVLVAWSYGGLVACDYLRFYGAEALSALVMVAAATKMAQRSAANHYGPGVTQDMPKMTATDFNKQYSALESFLNRCTAKPFSSEEFGRQIAINMMTPAQVRLGLISRKLDNDDVLSQHQLPMLCIQGSEDQMVTVGSSEHSLSLNQNPKSRLSFYEGVGHMPFVEETERFVSDLSAFIESL